MTVKQLWRLDGHGRTWLATNPSESLVSKALAAAFRQGWAVELSDYDLPRRQVGAA